MILFLLGGIHLDNTIKIFRGFVKLGIINEDVDVGGEENYSS